ncbi:MAG: Mitochondrial presequence protease [Chrysothrix sp. TS-e1954]|nr:MAG: Mitochondrial presequence protease [Chrysothrix sp. TS-e1954]
MFKGQHSSTRATARLVQRAAQLRRQCPHYATGAEPVAGPQAGESLHGFSVLRTKRVKELDLSVYHLQHQKTYGEYLHLAKEDQNNVFSIGFKTNPPDHTGVPHILEHLALCGSQKYPVRDPFFKMMPRSLNNFMNAMTYPDHTVYPFATTNHEDFRNLMAVYLDATLHPLLRKHDFAQEGWRIGPKDPKAPVSTENALEFKGVVYNEMKGNVSNADYLFNTKWQDHIFPAIENSGGDPQKMTDLTHGQLKKFHADHYNAANAKIVTYGNIPLETHLQQLGPQLDRFSYTMADVDIKLPISLIDSAPTVTVPGPTDPMYPKEEQYKASISWMMGDTADVFESFTNSIIASLLLEGFSAPLYQNTIGVGRGASYTPNTGYDSSGKRGIFTIGLSGLKKHDVPRLHKDVMNTLKQSRRVEFWFDMDKVQGRLHQLELSLKHKTPGFGMGLTSRLQDGWFNGVDPFNTVSPEELIAAFRETSPAYLRGLYDKYLLEGNTFTFVMEPEPAFNQKMAEEESSRLERKISEVNAQFPSVEEANKSLEEQETALLEIQEHPDNDDVSCLPSVHIRDVPRKIDKFELRQALVDDTKVQWREAPTNGLTYFRALQPIKDLPDDLRIYLPLFAAAIQRLGTKSLPLEKLEDRLRLVTGGVGVSHHATTSPFDLSVCSEGLAFAGTAIDRNVPGMYDLLRLIVRETDFTMRKAEVQITELVKAAASTAVGEIADSGHVYARRFAEAGLSDSARLIEEIDGLTQTRLMMDLAARSQSDEGLADLVDIMMTIQQFVLNTPTSNLRVALTCGRESTKSNEEALQKFLASLKTPNTTFPELPTSNEQMPFPRDSRVFFPLPYQNHYTARAVTTVPYVNPASPPLAVLAQLLTHKRLLPECREKGGAYGASASMSALKGTFTTTTYRDPNPARSLELMRSIGEWASSKQWSEREIEEAKLSVFQSVDAPEAVSDEGMALFLNGVDQDMEAKRRERLLDVTGSQLKQVAERWVRGTTEGQAMNEVVLGRKLGQEEWLNEDDWVEMPLGEQAAEEAESRSRGGSFVEL